MTASNTTQMSLEDALALALSLANSGDVDRACSLYADILAAVPDNATALMNLGVLRSRCGDLDEGTRLLEHAFEVAPEDETIRGNLRQACRVKSDQALEAGDWPAAIGSVRKLIALGDDDAVLPSNLVAFMAYSGVPAILSDFERDIAPEDLGRTVLIACMPKSGSSWLVSAMLDLTGFQQAYLSAAYIENDQDLHAPAVSKAARIDKVVHQHCRATAPTVQLAQAYGMSPVVLTRNLPDTLVSMRDFWDSGAVRNSFFYGDWNDLDETEKHDALIRHLGPWYIQFYVSWKLAESKGELAPLWVRYEDMIPEKQATLGRVAAFCGIEASEASIAGAVSASDGDRGKTRFNKGIAGRGAEAFTPAQLDALRDLTRPFPSIDFSPIGL